MKKREMPRESAVPWVSSVRPILFFVVLWLFGLPTWDEPYPALAQEPARGQQVEEEALRSTGEWVVAWVYFADQTQLNELTDVLDIWEVRHSQPPGSGYVVTPLSHAQIAAFRRAGMRVEIDAGKTALLYQEPNFLATPTSDIPGYPCYRTVEETYAALAALAAAHPTLAVWRDVGDSWNKANPGFGAGYDLHVLVLTNQAQPGPKPRFFLMAAIHAREMATAELATRYAEYLVSEYGHDPDVTWLLDFGEVHILPIVNPDGRKRAEQLLLWRKNTHQGADACSDDSPFFSYYGVDLNRNSSFKWNQCEGSSSCSTDDVCRDTFRGATAASEPETQAVEAYMRSLFPDQRGSEDRDAALDETTGVMISLHSYSRLVLFPWGWRGSPAPNHAQLQTLGHRFGYFTFYTVCQAGAPGCIYQADGTTDDWAYGELGIAAYTFELGRAFFEQCSSFEQTIVPSILPALLYAAKAARRPYQTPSGPESLQVVVSPTQVVSGSLVTLTAQANDTRFRSNFGIDEPTQPISAARYAINRPAWITGTTTYSLTAADGLLDSNVEVMQASIDTTGWAPGRHLLLVESQDAGGQWGVPGSVFVDIVTTPFGVTAQGAPVYGEVKPGASLSYSLSITNTGLVTDTFDLQTVGSTWLLNLPAQVGPLVSLARAQVALSVTAPITAGLGLTDTLTLTVSSQGDPTQQATVVFTTQVVGYRYHFPLVVRE